MSLAFNAAFDFQLFCDIISWWKWVRKRSNRWDPVGYRFMQRSRYHGFVLSLIEISKVSPWMKSGSIEFCTAAQLTRTWLQLVQCRYCILKLTTEMYSTTTSISVPGFRKIQINRLLLPHRCVRYSIEWTRFTKWNISATHLTHVEMFWNFDVSHGSCTRSGSSVLP